MTFEELIKKPIEELSDEEVLQIAEKMKLDQLASLERKIRKTVKKKPKKNKKKVEDMLNNLIAKGLGK